ncbi:hypothetical protein [Ferriphaselus sp. R-1]|uniref:hypothetical protein n=1 Tax=Ferriphaselus sp. R-1 TaxID=1485544 RepID=UPI00068BC783|nr:hypothetical protein [Ferriphaselus sp. R-1]
MSKKETQTEVATSAPEMRILKVASCPSLSQKSELMYHIGCDAEGAIYFRINANSAKGYFSREWVPSEKIGKALGNGALITSFTLQQVYVGKSQNNGGFLLAALLAEGLVQASAVRDRCHEVADGKAFFDAMQQLIESGVSLDPDTRPRKPSRKKQSSETAPSAE